MVVLEQQTLSDRVGRELIGLGLFAVVTSVVGGRLWCIEPQELCLFWAIAIVTANAFEEKETVLGVMIRSVVVGTVMGSYSVPATSIARYLAPKIEDCSSLVFPANMRTMVVFSCFLLAIGKLTAELPKGVVPNHFVATLVLGALPAATLVSAVFFYTYPHNVDLILRH